MSAVKLKRADECRMIADKMESRLKAMGIIMELYDCDRLCVYVHGLRNELPETSSAVEIAQLPEQIFASVEYLLAAMRNVGIEREAAWSQIKSLTAGRS